MEINNMYDSDIKSIGPTEKFVEFDENNQFKKDDYTFGSKDLELTKLLHNEKLFSIYRLQEGISKKINEIIHSDPLIIELKKLLKQKEDDLREKFEIFYGYRTLDEICKKIYAMQAHEEES